MKIEFEINDEYMPLAGVLILSCADAEGKPIIYDDKYGDPSLIEAIGLMTVHLDQVRNDFVDRGGD